MKTSQTLLLIFLGMILGSGAWAEYRAYELEVFDRTTKISETVITSFSPADYILTHGGPDRIGIIIRASWVCYGDTSRRKKVCPVPKPINPRYKDGDRVQLMLDKHLTHEWVGVVENSFFRPELRSNVYGIRFPDRNNLYTRYYEANLRKAP